MEQAGRYKAQDPRFGFELENGGAKFYLNEEPPPAFDQKVKEATKGSTLWFFTIPSPQHHDEKASYQDLSRRTEITSLSKCYKDANWKPTAETLSPGLGDIRLEIIYGGPTGTPVGAPNANLLAKAGFEIAEFLKQLTAILPHLKGSPSTPLIVQPENFIKSSDELRKFAWMPRADTSGFLNFLLPPKTPAAKPEPNLGVLVGGLQLTTSFPLAVIPSILKAAGQLRDPEHAKDTYGDVKVPSVKDDGPRYVQFFLLLNNKMKSFEDETQLSGCLQPIKWRTGLDYFGKRSAEGLLILMRTYLHAALVASGGANDDKLKHSSPLMPRTDFATMLNLVTDLMFPDSAKAFRTAIPTLFKQIPEFRNLAALSWKWVDSAKSDADAESSSRPTGAVPLPPPPPSKGGVVRRPAASEPQPVQSSGPVLAVQHWLEALCNEDKDLIADYDRQFRHGQIGGLANKVEYLIGSDKQQKASNTVYCCPIIEIRDLDDLKLKDIHQASPEPRPALQDLENMIRSFHDVAKVMIERNGSPSNALPGQAPSGSVNTLKRGVS